MPTMYLYSGTIKEYADFKSMYAMMLAMCKMHACGRNCVEMLFVGRVMNNI